MVLGQVKYSQRKKCFPKPENNFGKKIVNIKLPEIIINSHINSIGKFDRKKYSISFPIR